MTLRVRLLLTILLTAIPVTPVLLWLAARQERRSVEETVSNHAISMMNDWGRSACLRRPSGFVGGPAFMKSLMKTYMGWDPDKAAASRPARMDPTRFFGPPEMRTSDDVWAYRSDFVSDNPDAPAFPAGLKAALEGGSSLASEPFDVRDDPRDHLYVALRTEWPNEPCAILLVSHSAPQRPPLASNRTWFAVAQIAILVFAVLLACLPIVRRIRALTASVKESAAGDYAVPIRAEGRDEISGLARAFNEAGVEVRTHMQAVEKREESLRSFIANTTHDVMLPLTVLQGHLAELKSRTDAGEPVDPEVLAGCHREADYLTSIFQNLAAIAKLEGADYQLRNHPLSMNHLVDRVVARHRSISKVDGVNLDFSLPAEELEVIGDMTLLEQALGNVIHNAVRYNHPGGHVAVILDRVSNAGQFSLRVIDDGPGMSDEDLARLPERRFRGDAARARNPHGLGLGLHIARDVAIRHGFSLEIRQSEYGGLEVEFVGPLNGCGVGVRAPVSSA